MRFSLLLICLLGSAPALAHRASDAILRVTDAQGRLQAELVVALADLAAAVPMDDNGDGLLQRREFEAHGPDIEAWLQRDLSLWVEARPCTLSLDPMEAVSRNGEPSARLPLRSDCPAAGHWRIDYRLLFDLDPSHRGIVIAERESRVTTEVVSPHRHRVQVAPERPQRWVTFRSYLQSGVHHIWIGPDHVLFLLALLLPAWLRGDRRAPELPGRAVTRVAVLVTAFTLAHSMTLAAAVLGWVRLPASWVEPAIAASVLVAALHNFGHGRRRGEPWLAFGFGLLHGFGFASVLAEVGLPPGALALALLGFNLGVELGQLAIVAGLLPLLLALSRRADFYRRWILQGGSLLIAAAAATWLVQRLSA